MEDFKVKAYPGKNLLEIILGGYIMNSDIELVFYIARREIKLLKEGFEIKIDVRNFKTRNGKSQLSSRKIKELFKKMGAGRITYVQHNDFSMKTPPISTVDQNFVGLYAYENGWFL